MMDAKTRIALMLGSTLIENEELKDAVNAMARQAQQAQAGSQHPAPKAAPKAKQKGQTGE